MLQLQQGRTVVITIAGIGSIPISPASPVWANLVSALRASGDPHVPVSLLSAALETFRLGMRVKCDPGYEARQVLGAVEAALRAGYAFEARELAAPVQASVLIAIAQRVPGVLAVDLTSLRRSTEPAGHAQASGRTRLLAAPTRVQAGAALPAELLTLHTGPLDLLEEMP